MRWCLVILLSVSWPLLGSASEIDNEVRCLALNIYHEARGEPREGQLAVGYVTMNRVVNPRYPGSVCKVVWQRKQFSWTHDGRSDRPDNQAAWTRSLHIASFVYKNYYRFMNITKGATDLTGGALHYYAPSLANPAWAKDMVATRQIGSHVFLKDS